MLIQQWIVASKMRLNHSKSTVIIWFKVSSRFPEIVVDDTALQVVTKQKISGIILDNCLWHERLSPGSPITERPLAEVPLLSSTPQRAAGDEGYLIINQSITLLVLKQKYSLFISREVSPVFMEQM